MARRDERLHPRDEISLFVAGDVMTGRGIDQILAHSVAPGLREPSVDDARTYVQLAQAASGEVPAPVTPDYIWGDGLDVLRARAPDAHIVNLETSITDDGDFAPGKHVHYRMHPENVTCLRAAGIDVCSLANNHVLDFGPAGLADTLASLRAAGIEPAGAGREIEEARRPAAITVGPSARVLVAGVGSSTSGIPAGWAASGRRPGVDVLPNLSEAAAHELAERLERHRRPGDLTVVSLHWGSNWGYEIAPEMTRFARALIDGGVDVVHGHSSHHIRPIEIYRGKLILYGAGDLITDYEGIRGHEEFRGDLAGMIFPVLATPDGSLRDLRIAPMRVERMRLTSASPADAAWFCATLNRISRSFGTRFARGHRGELVLEDAGAR